MKRTFDAISKTFFTTIKRLHYFHCTNNFNLSHAIIKAFECYINKYNSSNM